MVDINSEVSEKVKKKSEQKAKTETIFLGNLKDNLISKIGSKITITDFDKGIDLKENILQSDTKNILIIEHPNCRKINDSLLSEDEDISAPIFDNYNKVVDFVTELKERLGKEKDLNFYFVCFNENALENINVDKAIKELSNLKLRNLAYFDRYNITSSFDRLKKFFHLNNYFSFYDNHKEKIGTKDFMYQSKKYRWNDDQGKPILMQPAWAKDLKFIGDDYF